MSIFKYFHLTRFLKGHLNIYYILLIIFLVIIYLITILIIYQCLFTQKKELKVKWPISFLRFFLPLFSFGLLTQFILFLNILFDCQDGKTYLDPKITCRTGNRYLIFMPFTVIALGLLFFISLITNTLYYRPLFFVSKSDVLKKTNSIPDISLFFTKILVILVFTIDNQKESEHWNITIFMMIITGINCYINLLYKNRLNITLMLLNIIFSLILFIGYFTLFIGKIFKNLGYNGGIYLFFLDVIFIIIFILFLKRKEIDYVLIDYKNINNDNEYINYLLKYYQIILNKNNSRDKSILLKSFIEANEETCTIIDCPLKLYLQELKKGFDYQYLLYQFLDELYKYGINKFKNNAMIKNDYAFFLIAKMNNKKQAINIINSINAEFISFHRNYNIYRCQKLINKWHFNSNNFQFNYRNNANDFKILIAKLSYLYYEFWSLLHEYKCHHNNNNFKKLYTVGSEIMKLNKRVEEIYNLIIKTKTNNIEIYKLYIEYLKNILKDEEKLHKYLNNASIFSESFENDEKDYFNFKMDNFKQNDLTRYLLLSGKKQDLGKILDCSISASTFFGYAKDEIIGKHINIFIPDIFHSKHNEILFKNAKTNNLKLYNHLFMKKEYNPNIVEGNFFGVLNSRFIKPLKLKNIFFKNEENTLIFFVNIKTEIPYMNELIKNRKIEVNNGDTRCCILTDDNFIINSYTPNCIEQLSLKYRYIKSNISIIPFIKQLYEDYLNSINDLAPNNALPIENIEKESIDESSRSFEIKLDNNNISNEIRKKIKVDLVNTKYDKKCQITWRINKTDNKIDDKNNTTPKCSRIKFRGSYSHILENKNEYKFEMELLMEIKKAIIDNKLLGYYFFFSKLYPYETSNFISYMDNEEKNGEIKQKVKYKTLIRSYQKLEIIPKEKNNLFSNSVLFKQKKINNNGAAKKNEIPISKSSKIKPKIKENLEKSSLSYENSLDGLNESKCKKYFTSINSKEKSSNELVIEDSFIPKNGNNFSFNLNSMSYKYEKDHINSKLLQKSLHKKAMEKIKHYQDYLKNLHKEEEEESDESESNSEEYEDDSNSEEDLDSSKIDKQSTSNNNNYLSKKNTTNKKLKKNISIRKSISLNNIINSKLEKLSPIRETHTLNIKTAKHVKELNEKYYGKEKKLNNVNTNKINANISQMKSIQENNNIYNYYRVNLNKIHYLIYDYNKDMFIEGKKKEIIIKIDDIINNVKKNNNIINIGKDENYPFASFKYNKEGNKNLKKQLIKDKIKNDKNLISEEKILSKKIRDVISNKDNEYELKLFKLYSILFFIFILILNILILVQNLYFFRRIQGILKILKNLINIKYCQNYGFYLVREIILLNFDVSNLNGGIYTQIPAFNMTLYRDLIKNKLIDYFLENQSNIKEILNTDYSHSKTFEKEMSESFFDSFYKNKNEIGNIEGDALSNLMQFNSIFYNLASLYTPLYQNHPDIFNFMHNSFNQFGKTIKFLWEKYISEISIQKRDIIISIIVTIILIISIYVIFVYLMGKSFISAAKKRISYMKVFYGVSLESMKNMMSNCEKLINKFKKDENRNVEDEDFHGESEEEKTLFQKNQKDNTSRDMALNNNLNNNDKIKLPLSNKILLILYILFMIAIFLYFPFTGYFLFNLCNKTKDYSDFILKLKNFHSNIIDIFNGYREYLFDNGTIIQNLTSFDYITKKEIEALENLDDDVFSISNFIFANIELDEALVYLFSKELCSYFITDLFNTPQECKNKIGKIINYDYSIFASNFVNKIRNAKNIVKHKHETELIYGDLQSYEVEKWATWNNTYFGEEEQSDKKKSFKLDLFNNNTLHAEINLIFINIYLPYTDENRKEVIKRVIIDGEKNNFIFNFIIFLVLIILMYILCLYPMIRYLYNYIYKTKRMLLLIPMAILSSQNNIKSLLNLS